MLNYIKVKRTITIGDNPGTKYLAQIFRGQEVAMDTVAREVSSVSTASYGDVLLVLKTLEEVIERHITNGNIVRMNHLGSFSPSIKAKAMNAKDDVNASTIQRVYCRFIPSKEFKRNLKETSVQEKHLDIVGLQN